MNNNKHRPKTSNFKFVFGTRCCSKCKDPKPNHNGTYEKFDGGRRQRWICHECSNKMVARSSG